MIRILKVKTIEQLTAELVSRIPEHMEAILNVHGTVLARSLGQRVTSIFKKRPPKKRTIQTETGERQLRQVFRLPNGKTVGVTD